VILQGDTFDDPQIAAKISVAAENKTYVLLFDDPKMIEDRLYRMPWKYWIRQKNL